VVFESQNCSVEEAEEGGKEMKIVRPHARIINPEILSGALRTIEYAARVSHRSEDAQTEESAERFIRAVVLQHGDWSVVEHVSASVEFLVDRGITHEIVRHRIASYTQESTRFVNYAKKMPPSFIYPKVGEECEWCLVGDEPENRGNGWRHYVDERDWSDCHHQAEWLTAIDEAEHAYAELIKLGWRPQEARSVFPNALASKIVTTCNLRSWRHFFLMRTSKEAHPQMRQVTIPLLAEFQRLVPILYEDIVPESRQVDNIAKGR
jgi:thymidylate synthase (FAD)